MEGVRVDTTAAPRLPRRRLAWLGALTLVAFFFGSFLAPMVLWFLEPLPRDVDNTYVTESAPMTVLRDDEAVTGTGHLEQHVRTSPGADRSEATAQSETSVFLGDEQIGQLREELTVDRGATFPVPGSPARQLVELGGTSADFESEAPAGLRHFFPFGPERRSYAYLDPVTRDTTPLDFVDEVTVGSVEAYRYTQTIEAQPVAGALAEVLPPRPDQHPYYSATRDLLVDSRTGRILDVDGTYHLYYAADGWEARQTSISEPAAGRTIFQQHVTWDEATKATRLDDAEHLSAMLRTLQVLAWIGTTAAVLLVLRMMYLVWKHRRALAARAARERS